jgi:hypothetical protein
VLVLGPTKPEFIDVDGIVPEVVAKPTCRDVIWMAGGELQCRPDLAGVQVGLGCEGFDPLLLIPFELFEPGHDLPHPLRRPAPVMAGPR